jgi:hypothetical protein
VNRRISSGLVAVLLLWISTPALACLAKPETMTPAEMQCCREMHGDCGEMAKAEHSCCPKTPARAQSDKVVVSGSVGKYVPLAPALTSEATETPAVTTFIESAPAQILAIAESPPGAPLPLRI